jgi:hypothetical protein
MALKIRRCEFVLPAENVRTGQCQRFCLEPYGYAALASILKTRCGS